MPVANARGRLPHSIPKSFHAFPRKSMAPRGAKIIYEVSLKPDRSAALAAQSMPALYGRAHGLPDGRNAVGFLSTKRPWQNLVLPRPLFPCPICAQRRPRITKSSGSCSRARQRTCQKRPARLPAFSWAPAHNGRLSAQSRATANTATG